MKGIALRKLNFLSRRVNIKKRQSESVLQTKKAIELIDGGYRPAAYFELIAN